MTEREWGLRANIQLTAKKTRRRHLLRTPTSSLCGYAMAAITTEAVWRLCDRCQEVQAAERRRQDVRGGGRAWPR